MSIGTLSEFLKTTSRGDLPTNQPSQQAKCHNISLCTFIYDGVVLIKLQTDAVHAMSLVGRGRIPFTLENVSQVTAAVTANDLRP